MEAHRPTEAFLPSYYRLHTARETQPLQPRLAVAFARTMVLVSLPSRSCRRRRPRRGARARAPRRPPRPRRTLVGRVARVRGVIRRDLGRVGLDLERRSPSTPVV